MAVSTADTAIQESHCRGLQPMYRPPSHESRNAPGNGRASKANGLIQNGCRYAIQRLPALPPPARFVTNSDSAQRRNVHYEAFREAPRDLCFSFFADVVRRATNLMRTVHTRRAARIRSSSGSATSSTVAPNRGGEQTTGRQNHYPRRRQSVERHRFDPRTRPAPRHSRRRQTPLQRRQG